MNRHTVWTIATIAALSCPAVDASPDAPLLERLQQYLRRYKQEMTALVADETYVQEIPIGNAGGAYRVPSVGVRRQQLTSEIIMSGQSSVVPWLGVRVIGAVDGQQVKDSGDRIRTILTSREPDSWIRAQELAAESARMNLGDDRNINLPTLPLQLLDSTNSGRFNYHPVGTKRVGVCLCTGLAFAEISKPTIIRILDGGDIVATGVVWIAPETGAVHRVELKLTPISRGGSEPTTMVVDFSFDNHLRILVPVSMQETYAAGPRIGTGKAYYSNYRRFETDIRIRGGEN